MRGSRQHVDLTVAQCRERNEGAEQMNVRVDAFGPEETELLGRDRREKGITDKIHASDPHPNVPLVLQAMPIATLRHESAPPGNTSADLVAAHRVRHSAVAGR